MTKNVSRSLALFSLFSAAAFSQTSSVLVGAGYSAPDPPQVAPGQVITLFYRSVGLAAGGEQRSGHAEAPLPTLLAGLSAQLIQGNSLFNMPLIDVSQRNTCPPNAAGPACLLTALKLQVPFEIAADVKQDQPAGPVTFSPSADLYLYADNQLVSIAPFQPVPDNSHVLTTCDIDGQTATGTGCGRVAFHRDGTPVNAGSPAAKGETINVLLYGLGQTSPSATTGEGALPGYFLTGLFGSPRVQVTFTSFVNALASSPRSGHAPDPNEVPATIAGAGLQAGAVGLYEIGVVLPASLSPAVACGGEIRSNYVMNVITSNGAERVPVCVAQ